MMHTLLATLLFIVPSLAFGQTVAMRSVDGRLIYGDLIGDGDRAVLILAHGGYSTRASWRHTAEQIAAAKFLVMVVESRAAVDLLNGKETPCLYDEICQAKDVAAATNDANPAGLRLPGIKSQYARASQPKEFVEVDGSAHGQRIFETPQADEVTRRVIRFLENAKR